jgi:hypothetical protein
MRGEQMRHLMKEDMNLDFESEHHPLSLAEKEIYDRSQQEEIPTIDDFSGTYPDTELARDHEWLKASAENRHSKPSRRSEMVEFLVSHLTETADWLGPEAMTSRTTEFDNRINHTDMVIEWEIDGEKVYLAVDATAAESPEVIAKKLSSIRTGMDKGHLGRIKYYESPHDGQKGELKEVPRAILAFDREGISKLSHDVVGKKPRELSKNPEQLLILEQIKKQMVDQMSYAVSALMWKLKAKKAQFGPEQAVELTDVARKALNMEATHKSIESVLETIDGKDKFLSRTESDPELNRYLENIYRLHDVYHLVENLLNEKSGSLGKDITQQATELSTNNIVMTATERQIRNFHIPATLRSLAT